MESQGWNQDEALTQLKQLVDSSNLRENRDELVSLFPPAAIRSPSSACRLFMRAIERLIKEKASPQAEICLMFSFITSSENPADLKDVLTVDLPEKFMKLQYYLRVYALRTLLGDKTVEFSPETLLRTVGNQDIGRITVIDFILTRSKPSQNLIQLLMTIANQLEDKQAISASTRRGKALKIFGISSEPCKEKMAESTKEITERSKNKSEKEDTKIDWNSINSQKSIISHWSQLVNSESYQIRTWIQLLYPKLINMHDSEKRSLSNALINLGTTFKNDPVVIEMWTLAIELEGMLQKPSASIFNKLWRLTLALKLHPNSDTTGVVKGTQLCMIHIGVQENAESLSDEQLSKFSGFASALYQVVPCWSSITDRLVDWPTNELGYKRPITWLMIVLAGMGASPSRECVDKLMSLALKLKVSTNTRIELEHAYCSAFASCYDQKWLASSALETESEMSRNRALATLAKSCCVEDPCKAYQWCQQLTSASHPAVASLIIECGFLDLAAKLQVDVNFPHDVPLNQLLKLMNSTKAETNTLKFVDLLVSAWYTLYKHGCQQDALKYLKAALRSSRKLFGTQSVRYRGILRMLNVLMPPSAVSVAGINFVDSDASASCNTTSSSDIDLDKENGNDNSPKSSQSYPANLLDPVVELFANTWLSPRKNVLFDSFNEEYNKLRLIVGSDPVWSLISESAIAYPSMVTTSAKPHSVNMKSSKALREQFIKVYSSIPKSSEQLDWIKQVELAQRVQLLQLVGANLVQDQNIHHQYERLVDSLSTRRLQNKPIQASRLFYSNQHFDSTLPFDRAPAGVVCLCLNFDEQETLCVTRIEPTGIVATIRLPGARRNEIQDDTEIEPESIKYNTPTNGVDGIIEDMDNLIQRSINAPTEKAQEFWKLQSDIDCEMKAMIESLQKTWFGGFLGLLCAPPGGLYCEAELLERVESVFGSYIEYQRLNRVDWHITPIFVAVLRFALKCCEIDEIEDVVLAIFDSMILQGLPVSLDEINILVLVKELKEVFSSTQPTKSSSAEEEQKIVLICDRKATQIPWEIFPVFKQSGAAVTRALSLHQVQEWSMLPKHNQNLDNPQEQTTSYLVNPGNDLPSTHKMFIQDFAKRGWTGSSGLKPTENQFATLLRNHSNFVYVGHGSGKSYIRGSELRQMYASRAAVYLLGCNSVRVKNPFVDDDALTDYSIMGSSLIMGTLWAVKDKDFNRFSLEFLSRIFDEKQAVGRALYESRSACVLPYLTGGAPVVYGLP